MSNPVKDVLAALTTGNFDSLVGMHEEVRLECKREPYHLSIEAAKFELVKDICGLANAKGGILLLGFATTTLPEHSDDRISAVTPFPSSLFDATQYRQIIEAWTWPNLREIDIFTYTSRNDPGKIVAALVVPPITRDLWPVLSVRSFNSEAKKRVEFAVGCFERKHSHTAHLDAREFHQLVRDGHRHDEIVRDEIASLRAIVTELRDRISTKPENASTPSPPSSEIKNRVTVAVTASGLVDESYLLLLAIPPRKLNIQGIFESRNSEEAQLIANPPKIRSSGFSIAVEAEARIEAGLSRRAVEREGRLIEVYEDGLAIFIVRGDGGGLSWAAPNRGGGELLINQLALVEYVYQFTLFTYELYSKRVNFGEKATLVLALQSKEGTRYELKSHALRGFGRTIKAKSAGEELDTSITVGAETAERAAFMLLLKLYAWFGFDGDAIPYCKGHHSTREIDPDQLKAL